MLNLPRKIILGHGFFLCVLAFPLVGLFKVSAISTNSGVIHCCTKDPEALIDPAIGQLKDRITGLLTPREQRSENWGVLVVSLENGDTLFAHAKDKKLSPASNMKLYTTAAALHLMGSKFRYHTFLYQDGPILNGHLQGDLILYGTGDPGISERFSENKAQMYQDFLVSLEQAGVKVIEGDVIGDATYFSGPEIGPEWNKKDLNDWFTAPVSALSINENVVTLQILPAGITGAIPHIYYDHEDFSLPIYNTARTVAGRPTAPLWLDRETPDSEVHIYGQIRTGSPGVWRRLTVPDPALLAASELKGILVSNGIEVKGDPKSVNDERFSRITRSTYRGDANSGVEHPDLVDQHISPEILEYLQVINHESHNLFAEALLKTMGRITGEGGSFEGGAAAIQRFLREEVGIQDGHITISDGSGLSASNESSPQAFIQLLTYVAKRGQWQTFLSTLPEAGRSLRRMYRTGAARNLKAKTGTIEGVSALTGVVKTRDDEELLFSIISNGVRSTSSSKRIEDLIGSHLANFKRTPRSHW